MPGLKALADAMPKHHQSRAVAIYTASFTVGTSLSFLLAGELNPVFGWRLTFTLLALGPLAGLLVGVAVIAPRPPTGETPRTALLDFRPVLRDKRSLAYMIAYAVHNAESSCMRAWAVAFLVFSQAQQAAVPPPAGWSATTITTAAYLGGLPAIIIANELARLFGRRVVIVAVMAASATAGVLLGLAATGAFWLVVVLMFLYGFTVPADSGTINAGLVATADPRHRGQALAMQAVFGFTGAFVAPVLFGTVLDLGGGEASAGAWILAFAAMAAVVALGPLALMTLERPTPRPAG
jgi:MFS family permease